MSAVSRRSSGSLDTSAQLDHDLHAQAADSGPPPEPPQPPRDRFAFLRSKPVQAALTFVLIAAIPYAHPKLKKLRLIRAPWDKPESVLTEGGPTGITPEYGELKLNEAQNEKPPMLEEKADEHATSIIAGPSASSSSSAPAQPIVLSEVAKAVGATYRAIEDPSGHAMDGFYASLAKTEKGVPGAITRVAHYGDSLIVSDFMSSTLRRRFQSQFGDAGHGFILVAKPWAWYFHMDVNMWSSEGWRTNRIVNPRIADELYGYGGASFRTADGGTKATFGTAKPIPGLDPKDKSEAFGRRVSRFGIHYLEQPDGGSFDVSIDGKKQQTISTRAVSKKLVVADVKAQDDGEHTMEIRALGGSEVRFFGVTLERDVPGVQWDALGVNGGRARMLDVNDDAHWAESLRARDPAMVILQYGTNESEDTGLSTESYEASLEAVLRQVKNALPSATCLVVGPMDRAGHGAGGMETRPIILRLEESQRKVAFKVGCAFWDTFLAMGGSGAMGRWVKSNPKLGGGDLTHPTMTGAAILGDLLYAALLEGYRERAVPKTP